MWSELFPEALIVGVDWIADLRLHQRPSIAIIIADVRDPAKLAAISTLHGPWDVVVDDASHLHDDVRIAFEELYPRVREGGWYFVEDLDPADPWVQQFAARWGGTIHPARDEHYCLIAIERR
jgi:demethylmacrocin O-methyltransferase